MTYKFEEMDLKAMREGVNKGDYPPNITLDEYHYRVNQAIDQMRGK